MSSGGLGSARKSRGIYEGPQWAESLAAAQITVEEWDLVFLWGMESIISVQPLEGTHSFLDHEHRLIQFSQPNRMIAWVYFRIDPDDENCTLLWIEVRRFHRVG